MKFSLAICLSPMVAEPSFFAQATEAPTAESVIERTRALATRYLAEFQHPETGVLYGARLSGRERWTSPEDVLKERPKPWGYGSRIADTALHTGHMLAALMDVCDARPDPWLEEQVERTRRSALHDRFVISSFFGCCCYYPEKSHRGANRQRSSRLNKPLRLSGLKPTEKKNFATTDFSGLGFRFWRGLKMRFGFLSSVGPRLPP